MGRETAAKDAGFAGLGAFSTHIDAALIAADELAKTPVQAPASSEPAEPTDPEPVDRDLGALAGFGRLLKAGVGFAVAIAVVVGLKALLALGVSGSSTSDRSSSSYGNSFDSTAGMGAADEGTSPYDDIPMDTNLAADLPGASDADQRSADDSTAYAEGAGGIGEQRPSPSDLGTTYNDAQIRYCLAEDIRLSGAKDYADRLSVTDPDAYNRVVEPFNNMVSDYNSRCAGFYYEQFQMTRIRGSVENRRSSLEAEGRRRLQ